MTLAAPSKTAHGLESLALTRGRRLLLSRHVWVIVGLFSIVAAVNFVTLLRPIEPYFDDSWIASRAWAVMKTGYAFSALDAGVLDNYPGHWTYFWLFGHWINSLFIRVLGPNLFAVRIVSYLLGLALLAIAYLLATRLYSRRAGMLAVVAGASSFPFAFSSHVGRHDIMVAVLGFGALALYLYQDHPGLSLGSVLSGLALSLTLDIHPTGIVYPPVILTLLLFDYRRSVLRVGRMWGFLLGYALGLIYYAAVHVIPYPETYFAISRIQQGSYVTTPPITTLDPGVWLSSLWRSLSLLERPVLLLVAAAWIILLLRPARSDARVMVIFASLVLTFASVVPLKPMYYAILLAPASWLVLSAAGDRALSKIGSRVRPLRTLLATAMVALIFLNVMASDGLNKSRFLTRDNYPSFQAAMELVRRTVPSGTTIIGLNSYWFARPDDPYLVWEQFSYYRRYKPGSTLEDAFRDLHPDYVIIDDLSEDFLIDEPNWMSQNVAVLKSEMWSFLDNHATLAAQQENWVFGNIRIYMINW